MIRSKNKRIIAALFVAVLSTGIIMGSFTVAGESSTGEIRVDPGQTQLDADESKNIDIKYDTLSAANPEGIEVVIEYDPNVIAATEVNRGGYGDNSDIFADNSSVPGRVKIGLVKSQSGESFSDDKGTVATVAIELADGVNQSDTTNITFTDVEVIGGSTPETINGTVEAAEGNQKTPQDGSEPNVQIVNPTLSDSTIDSSPSEYTLSFDAVNVSSDGDDDVFTVRLPDNVTVESINKTEVIKKESGEIVEIVGDDPATNSNPGNKISFTVAPEADTKTQTLSIEVEMKLSATD